MISFTVMSSSAQVGVRKVRADRWQRASGLIRFLNAASDTTELVPLLREQLPPLLRVASCALYIPEGDTLQLLFATSPATEGEGDTAALRALAGYDRVLVLREAGPGTPARLLIPAFVQNQLAAAMVVERRLEDGKPGADEAELYRAILAGVAGALRFRGRTAALEAALRELQQAQADLTRVQQVAAVGKLAFDISHELKNRLTSMTFAVQNVRDVVVQAGHQSAALKASLDLLDDDIRRMRNRVAAFYAMARPRESREALFRASEVAHRAVEQFRRDPRAAVIVLREEYGSNARVRADEEQLSSAVANLLLNAFEALEGEGGGEVAVAVRCESQRVRITVTDNGPGVPPEIRERIFDAFYGTNPRGTGLGLSQVFVFAEQSGGRAYLAETVHGARFVIDLPEASP